MLEYGSRATSVITIAVGNLSLISLIERGTMPVKKIEKIKKDGNGWRWIKRGWMGEDNLME